MTDFVENLLARFWNSVVVAEKKAYDGPGLELGSMVVDGREVEQKVLLPTGARPEHIAVLGRTGTGKSTLLKRLAAQDIREDRGFAYFDLHGDATPELLRRIADQERSRGIDLSGRVIVIEPADPDSSI